MSQVWTVGQNLSVHNLMDPKYVTFECFFSILEKPSNQFEEITIMFNQMKIILRGGER